MQRATPPERQGDVATALMDGVQVRGLWQSAGIENGYTGHALVIDQSGLVRWRGSGYATSDDEEELRAALRSIAPTTSGGWSGAR